MKEGFCVGRFELLRYNFRLMSFGILSDIRFSLDCEI